MSKSTKRLSLIVFAGFLLRLIVAANTSGFEGDMRTFGDWGEVLTSHSFGDYYKHAYIGDHLPGDLYLHWVIAHIHEIFGTSNYLLNGYQYLIKLVPIIADTLLVIAAITLVKSRIDERATLILALILSFSPPVILVSAVWGQWDSVSMAIFMAGLALLWSKSPRPFIAVALFSCALLMKPPLFLLVAPAVIGYVWTQWKSGTSLRSQATTIGGMLAIAVGCVTLMMLPFGMTWFES